MRKWINLFENILPAEETKFWYSSTENRFVFHDIDTHHTKVVAQNPEEVGLTATEVVHHPHASGDTSLSQNDEYGDEYDDEEWANNDDMGLFAKMFENKWVRGGHHIDVMSYHDYGEVRPDDTIYLQSNNLRAIRRCVKACMTKWSWVDGFTIQYDTPEGEKFFKLTGWEDIESFIKSGRYSNIV